MALVWQKTSGLETVEPNLYYHHDRDRWYCGFWDPKAWDKRKQEFGKWAMLTLYHDPVTKKLPVTGKSGYRAARHGKAAMMGQVVERTVVAANETTLDDICKQWLDSFEAKVIAGERARGTWRTYEVRYRAHIKPRFGAKKVSKITPEEIEGFYDDLRRAGLSNSTRVDIHGVFIALLDLAARRGVIGASPMNRVSKHIIPKREKRNRKARAGKKFVILEDNAILRMAAAMAAVYRIALFLLAYTGMRVSEAIEIRWSDIDFGADRGKGLIRPVRQWQPNEDVPDGIVGAKSVAGSSDFREIMMLPALREKLLAHHAAEVAAGRGRPSDLVVNDEGERVTRGPILKAVKTAAKAIGIEQNFYTHMLRHTFFSQCAAARVDTIHAQHMAGHSSPEIHEIYRHYFAGESRRDEAHEAFAKRGFGQTKRSA